MNKKKICIVAGEDVHKRIDISKYLINDNFDVTILGTSVQEFPKRINYVPYNLYRKFSFKKDYNTIKFYKSYFKNNSFDIIHAYNTKPSFLLPLALLFSETKTPISRTITGLGTIFMSKRLSDFILRNVYYLLHIIVKNRVAHTIFQNIDDRDVYLKKNLIDKTKYSLVLSSGIELKNITEIAKRNNNQFTFICVARLVYEKGIINLLEAARICKAKGYDFKYQIVGPLEENTVRFNEEILKQYDDIVDRLGTRGDIMELLLKADAFVLPTFGEGFPRVLLEAAAVGLPIVTTDVPGIGYIARHEKEALITEVRNSEALANAMIRLSNNKTLADELSKNALIRVKMFSLETVASEYISIFNEVIDNNTN